ncbi:MAG: ABC transporter, ATP-binding protein (cluster 10, nitrate/sulfonate/bicarbonate), partial [uncultured Ramlibacter sp.]
ERRGRSRRRSHPVREGDGGLPDRAGSDAGARRRELRDPQPRVRLHHRPVGLRQDHHDEHRRGLRAADPGPRAAGRQARHPARARPGRDLPGVRRFSLAHGAAEHRVRPQARRQQGRRLGAGRDGRALHAADGPAGFPRPLPQAPLGRHAPAPGHCPRVCSQAGVPADGRAVRRARRADPLGDAGPAARGAAERRQDRHADHALGRGSDLSLLAHRGGDGAAGPHPHHHRRAVRLPAHRECPRRSPLRRAARAHPRARDAGVRSTGPAVAGAHVRL